MRYIASSLVLAWTFVGASLQMAGAAGMAVGGTGFQASEETPNQRRIILGQPIVASFPPPEYGESIETPNHRRRRLGLPLPVENEPVLGVSEETPNHRRARLGSQTAATQK